MSHTYSGHCHCGAIKFSYPAEEEITQGVRCNCSMCARKGAVMSSELIPFDKIQIEAKDGALGLYQFGAKTAKHYFCKECGIYTFHETARKAEHCRVNLACIDEIDVFALPVEVFDGKHLL